MSKLRHLFLLFALLALAVSIGYVQFVAEDDGHDRTAEELFDTPEPATDFKLETLDGGILTSAELKGDIVVLDFWATWCAPCITEIPHYNDLHQDYKDRGVHLLGVTLESGGLDDVRAFVDAPQRLGKGEVRFNYPIFMGNDQIATSYGPIFGFPTTFLLGPNWQIRKTWIGAKADKEHELRILIDALLEDREALTDAAASLER